MHNNLNRQILRGAVGISMTTCMFSDAYIFYDKRHWHVYFSVITNHKRQYKHILCQSNTKKTNLSCICQKSQLNGQEIGVFRWYFGDSSDRKTNIKAQDYMDLYMTILFWPGNVFYQQFLLFPQGFQKLSFSGLSKVRIVW